jgi:hypothetical protein
VVDFSSLLWWLIDSFFKKKKLYLINKTAFETDFMGQKICQTKLNSLTKICFYLKAFTWGAPKGAAGL